MSSLPGTTQRARRSGHPLRCGLPRSGLGWRPQFDEFPDETGFRLKVALSDQKLLTLAEFSDPTSALYLERELERALGIVDQPVGV